MAQQRLDRVLFDVVGGLEAPGVGLDHEFEVGPRLAREADGLSGEAVADSVEPEALLPLGGLGPFDLVSLDMTSPLRDDYGMGSLDVWGGYLVSS